MRDNRTLKLKYLLGGAVIFLLLSAYSRVTCIAQNESRFEGDEAPIFEETFTTTMNGDWQWLRENPSRWCIRNNGLEIRVMPGLADTVENALVISLPASNQGEGVASQEGNEKGGEGEKAVESEVASEKKEETKARQPLDNFAIEVTISHLHNQTNQYEQAGITWYVEGRSVFKLVKELLDGQVVIIPGRKEVKGDWVQLRLEVSGKNYVAKLRHELNADYSIASQGEIPRGSREEVSIQCYHGPEEAEHWVRFDDFRIFKVELAK